MTEAAALLAAEFKFWLEELNATSSNVKTALEANPIDPDDLRDHFEEMNLASTELEAFRPGKKVVNYEFASAIAPLATAKKLSLKAVRHMPKPMAEEAKSAPVAPTNSRKIPEVEIAPFEGDITQFANFMKSFQMKYDGLPISKSEKLLHLKHLVTGGPGKKLEALAITDDNYDRALQSLQGQYENEQDVISALYDKIKKVPVASGQTASLSATYYELAGILSALESHGQDIDAFPPLRDDVSAKYPFGVVQHVSLNKFLPTSALQREILTYIQLKERSELRRPARPPTPPRGRGVSASLTASKANQKNPQSNPQQKQQSSLGTNPPPNQKTIPPCAFCAETHYSSSCPTHTTLEMRRAVMKNRCSQCLKPNHTQATCRKTVTCHYCRQVNKHNSALCPQQFGKQSPEGKSEPITPNTPTGASATLNAEQSKISYFVRTHKGAHVTAMVTIEHPETKKKFAIRALLDSGSNESYIAETAAQRIGLQLTNFRNVPVTVFLKDKPVSLRTATTNFLLTNGADFNVPMVADTAKVLPQRVHLFDYEEFKALYPQYSHLQFIDQAENKPIEMLIGSDYYYDIIRDKSTIAEGLHLQQTHFGWILVGRQPSDITTKATYFQMSPQTAIAQLSELESIGIAELPLSAIAEEERALSQFYENITFRDNRYEIRWPWRHFPPNLPQNFGLAVGRLKTMQRKLTQQSFDDYNTILDNQIRTGIVAEIPSNEVVSVKHFLPHQVIVTPEKSTPLRLVLDGSAKTSKQKSINDEIYKGRNMLADGGKIIIRWRLYIIVSVSDLEKAFHQLLIHPADTFYVCFIWLFDLSKPVSGHNLRFLRFLRVVFGITASPFLLLATIRFHLKKYEKLYPHIVKKLLRDSFADNFATGFLTEQEAEEFYHLAVKIFQDCSMNLRKWASNSPQLRANFQQLDRSDNISVLGIIWNQYEDTIKLQNITYAETDTLRTVLSTTAQLYDPVGWYSPVLLVAKDFLRDIHRHYDWDDSLSPEHCERWHQIRDQLQQAAKNTVQRFQCTLEEENAQYTLHVFTDASAKACACAIYLQKRTKDRITTHLIFSKTKLAKIQNIPKLELIAVLLGMNALTYVRDALQLSLKAYLWCDSKCVLSWLNTDRILPVFIERQVRTINVVPEVEKRYVPSAMNIADLPSRGGAFADLTQYWFNGPDWLQNPADWPEDILNAALLSEPAPEEDLRTVAVVTAPKYPFDLTPNKYSNILTLLRITVYLTKFISSFRVSQQRNLFPITNLFEAQRLWIRSEQQNHFYDVITALENQKTHPLITKFNLYLDQKGIIRCAGRFQHAPLTPNERRPIFLPSPKISPFVELLLNYYHITSFHAGLQYVLTAFRRRYWIPAGRRTVQNLLNSCKKCKRYTTRPYPQPQNSEIPPFRLEENIPPFRNIGIDIFGPLYANTEKRWVLLVTDLVVRAIDLELLDDMTAERILLAFRIVIARRSTPKFILSDNAPQFLAVKQVFERQFTHSWDWKFLPEHSPWMGGAYERMVKLVKDAITRTFHNIGITDYVLRTSLAEIAAVLNSRPITAVTDDLNDAEPLTPNQFLHSYYQEENTALEIPAAETKTLTARQLVTIARCCAANLDRFWAQWRVAYLQHLREKGFYRNQLFPQRTALLGPKKDSVVLIAEKLIKRNQWKLGKIIELIPSEDGIVRSARVKTQHGTLIRPLTELYPLEICDDFADIKEDNQLVNPPEVLTDTQDTYEDWDIAEISVEEIDDD